MARKKQTSPVHDELISFLFFTPAERETPEYKARLNSLWEEHFAGKRMTAADAEDAHLITFMCSHLATQEERYADALYYIDTFLRR